MTGFRVRTRQYNLLTVSLESRGRRCQRFVHLLIRETPSVLYEEGELIENNYDGQLNQIMRMEYPEDITHVHSLALGDGLPMTAPWIVNKITEQEAK